MHKNAETLRDALESNARDTMLERTELIVSRLQSSGVITPGAISGKLREYNAGTGRLLAAIIFTKTADENFYRTSEIIHLHENFTPGLQPRSIVRQEKEVNYLKKGRLHGIVDPAIYTGDGYCWQNAYYPIDLGKKKGILQLMMTASTIRETLEGYVADTKTTQTVMIVIAALLVLAVVLLTLIFLQNYSLLLGNLSQFMEKAAGGDLNISLKETGDDELDQLAQSFNTLIEEMKDLSARPSPEPGTQTAPVSAASEPAPVPEDKPGQPAPGESGTAAGPQSDETGVLFTSAVTLLKNNELDDAIAMFRTLTIVKPQGFGSWFNLGVAHAKKRDYDKAILMFEKARRLNPGFEVTTQYIEKLKRLIRPDA